MMAPAGIRIALGQQDAIAPDLVDGADMVAVRSDHFHMLGDFGQSVALSLPLVAPAAEFIFEFGAVLVAIFLIIAVERLDLRSPPAVIVVIAAIAPAAAQAFVIARIHLAPALGLVVAEPRAD